MENEDAIVRAWSELIGREIAALISEDLKITTGGRAWVDDGVRGDLGIRLVVRLHKIGCAVRLPDGRLLKGRI